MASGAFFNPRVLLLSAPLVSSSITLWYARDQSSFLSLFTQPPVDRKKANEILPSYISGFYGSGPWAVLTFIGITFTSSIANIWSDRGLLQSRGSLFWYGWSAALAFGHLAYVPAVAWKLRALWEDNCAAEGTDNVGMLERWLTVNNTRLFTTDLGAWLCAIVAISRTLTV
ncbi:hypothetical protein NW762_009461 [Fusarium torreyae]|uniref:Uncharacterized protein n=1 Tax=Fusarium torreyae TaxID=1237075 RepID=A0A9W8VE90_9HYPO|nr:hypothetical protein NW762_009461 [Fusarium torreyae]